MKYTTRIDPFVFEGQTFSVRCADAVVRQRIENFITDNGGTLDHREPDFLVGENGLSPVQFWVGAGEYDRLQRNERLEEALIFLSSETPFSTRERENVLWYIRENREEIVSRILEENLTDALEGYLAHYHEALPGDYTILQPGQYRDQILLDLTDELIGKASAARKHELKAWLLDYKKRTFPDSFVDAVEQDKLDKELGFTEQNEYDWLKLFSFTYEDDGVHIDRYKGDDPFVLIPDEIAGKPVTSVAVRSFYGCDGRWQFAWQRPARLVPSIDRSSLAAAQPGGTIRFGLYPVDKAGNTAPIEWTVLKKEDSRILVITKYCIDKSAYHSDFEPTSWESCHLRRWLNGPFRQLAFTPGEQAMIPAVHLPNEPNPKYKTGGGRETEDWIFALSLREAGELFESDEARLGFTTLYAQSRGYYFGGKINCWWLRCLGADASLAALVGNSGSLGTYGYRPDNGEYAIRPAMWIDFGGSV